MSLNDVNSALRLHVRGDIKLLIGEQQIAVVSAIDLALTSDCTLLP